MPAVRSPGRGARPRRILWQAISGELDLCGFVERILSEGGAPAAGAQHVLGALPEDWADGASRATLRGLRILVFEAARAQGRPSLLPPPVPRTSRSSGRAIGGEWRETALRGLGWVRARDAAAALAALDDLEARLDPGGLLEEPTRPSASAHDWRLAPLASVVTDRAERALEWVGEVGAQRRLVRIALALRLHRLDHGAFPESLDALVPSILPSVPLDPISGRAFAYARRSGGVTL